ncbi:MAG: FGGY-family carbohydrate kinase [Pseudomonadota bacterium]
MTKNWPDVPSESYAANPAAAVHAYAHCVPGRWFQMAAMLNGASPMQWFAEFAQEDIGALLSEAALIDTDTAPLFLPYLTGERTPHNDPNIRGAFYGLTPAAGRADAMRGIINAVAYCFCDGRDSLGAAAAGLDRVAAIGGGARSDLVLQTLSDALGVSMVRFADAEQGPALGAARLAMVASGDMTVAEAAETPETDRAFEPNAEETKRHARTLERWRELYRALKPFAAESAAAS